MRIDAEQCCLDHTRFSYPWIRDGKGPLRKDYHPEHIERILKRNRFDGMVLGPACGSLDETHWLLELAAADPMVLAVVGGPAALGNLPLDAKLRGVREMGDTGLKSGEIEELARRGLVLEVGDLRLASEIADRFDSLTVVVDHMGNPPRDLPAADAWAEKFASLAAWPNVFAKISGLVSKPQVALAMRTFGPERLMFGSDWPFLLEAVDAWKKVLAAFTQALGAQPMEVRSMILGENAMRVYGIPSLPPAQSCSPDG